MLVAKGVSDSAPFSPGDVHTKALVFSGSHETADGFGSNKTPSVGGGGGNILNCQYLVALKASCELSSRELMALHATQWLAIDSISEHRKPYPVFG